MRDTIEKREAIDMMNRCKHEILELRGIIARLEPKADAYDNLVVILRLLPRQTIGMRKDLIWTLDRRIRELEATPASSKEGDSE